MDDAYIGTIFLWAPNFAPVNYAFCNGAQMQINQNQALFALIGATYGGNGSTFFNLPNFMGRAPVGVGQIAGGSMYALGAAGGSETKQIGTPNLPSHTHGGQGLQIAAYDIEATAASPGTAVALGRAVTPSGLSSNPTNIYVAPSGTATPLSGQSVTGATGPAGGNLPLNVVQPYLAVNYIIAVLGLWPPRP